MAMAGGCRHCSSAASQALAGGSSFSKGGLGGINRVSKSLAMFLLPKSGFLSVQRVCVSRFFCPILITLLQLGISLANHFDPPAADNVRPQSAIRKCKERMDDRV